MVNNKSTGKWDFIQNTVLSEGDFKNGGFENACEQKKRVHLFPRCLEIKRWKT